MSACPLNYEFCRDTVTIYRFRDGKYERTVTGRACLQWKTQLLRDRMGSVVKHSFLLILPAGTTEISPGDWVVAGEGPEPPENGTFYPGMLPGLGQISRVQEFRWKGKLCHTEAMGE